MPILHVEKLGGLAGFGGGHLRSRGEIDTNALSSDDLKAVEDLFKRGSFPADATRDGFVYRISRTTSSGVQTIDVPERLVPAALAGSVRDEIS